MMTGRELILYILANGLEDRPIFENGRFIGFMTVAEAAVKFSVGEATVRTWFYLGQLPGILIGEKLFIPANAKSPLEGKNEKDSQNDICTTVG